MVILFSCLLLSLSVKIDCSKGAGNGAGDDCSQGVAGTSEVKNHVQFILYKQWGKSRYGLDISNLGFRLSLQPHTKILVHGWNDVNHTSIIPLIIAYLDRYKYNIILANWNDAGGLMGKYKHAKNKVPEVAEQLGIYIGKFCSKYGHNPRNIHVIGHGLGAHIAGLSEKYLVAGRIGRVTGLDPSTSGFSYEQTKNRISEDSALFVDIIHTSRGRFDPLYEFGKADFFPNGGRWPQPGCKFDWKGISSTNWQCSHKRALKYYEESIRDPYAFLSTPCFSWSAFKEDDCDHSPYKVHMGESTPWSAYKGRYYLYTRRKEPFNKL